LKGQYLAVETVFTFGLGLIVAIGVIALFHQYRMGIMDDAEPDQVELVSSELLIAMNSLEELDEDGKYGSGRYQLDLPDTIAGRSYSIRMGENLSIQVGGEEYRTELDSFQGYRFEGGVSGGDVTVFKDQNNFTLRAQ
jgi:hypothetical protein